MKYIIIENEELALDLLKAIVNRLRPDWELVFTAESVEETVNFINEGGNADLCFMDIDLNDGECFNIFSESDFNIPTIFTTAYDEFTLRAFKVNSIDYLLKPILDTDVETGLAKFEKLHIGKPAVEEKSGMYREIAEFFDSRFRNMTPQRILTMAGDNIGFVNTKDIAWLVSEDKYVFAIDKTGNKKLTNIPNLTEAEGMLDPASFFRIQRNIICTVDSISKVSRFFKGRLNVVLKAGDRKEEIMVSSERRKAFLSWLGS